MCHMSGVTCHASGVRCQIFFNCKKKKYKEAELVGGGSVINGASPFSFLGDTSSLNYDKNPFFSNWARKSYRCIILPPPPSICNCTSLYVVPYFYTVAKTKGLGERVKGR